MRMICSALPIYLYIICFIYGRGRWAVCETNTNDVEKPRSLDRTVNPPPLDFRLCFGNIGWRVGQSDCLCPLENIFKRAPNKRPERNGCGNCFVFASWIICPPHRFRRTQKKCLWYIRLSHTGVSSSYTYVSLDRTVSNKFNALCMLYAGFAIFNNDYFKTILHQCNRFTLNTKK